MERVFFERDIGFIKDGVVITFIIIH
jgi:hypothetical protein